MGGALALHSGYRFVPGLGGIFALSSFLNKNSAVYSELKSESTPFIHGSRRERHNGTDFMGKKDL